MKPYTLFDVALIVIPCAVLRPVVLDDMKYLGACAIYGFLLGVGKYFIIPFIFGNPDGD